MHESVHRVPVVHWNYGQCNETERFLCSKDGHIRFVGPRRVKSKVGYPTLSPLPSRSPCLQRSEPECGAPLSSQGSGVGGRSLLPLSPDVLGTFSKHRPLLSVMARSSVKEGFTEITVDISVGLLRTIG